VEVRTAKELPLRLGILLDTSNSEKTSRIYRPGLTAILDLVGQVLSGPDDKVFFLTFDTTVRATGFMSRDEFSRFTTNATPGGATALYDAVYFACKDRIKVDPAEPARRVLVILSDGGDNLSHVDHEKAIAAAQEVGAAIFALSTGEGLFSTPEERRGDRTPRQFGDETGGRAFLDLSPGVIPKVFHSIQEQIDNMYVVTYVEQANGKQGKRRIELTPVSDKKLKLRAPKAFYAVASTP
jgi:VWFA-related protein